MENQRPINNEHKNKINKKTNKKTKTNVVSKTLWGFWSSGIVHDFFLYIASKSNGRESCGAEDVVLMQDLSDSRRDSKEQ